MSRWVTAKSERLQEGLRGWLDIQRWKSFLHSSAFTLKSPSSLLPCNARQCLEATVSTQQWNWTMKCHNLLWLVTIQLGEVRVVKSTLLSGKSRKWRNCEPHLYFFLPFFFPLDVSPEAIKQIQPQSCCRATVLVTSTNARYCTWKETDHLPKLTAFIINYLTFYKLENSLSCRGLLAIQWRRRLFFQP